jgi:hypothetical protein
MAFWGLLMRHLSVVKQDLSRIAAVSHEFLGQHTLGAADSQAIWRRIILAELDRLFAHFGT